MPQTSIGQLAGALTNFPPVDIATLHNLSGHVYARTMFIPAGCCLVGATHKTDHINIVLGDITVTTASGPMRVTGYRLLPAQAGHKRAGYAHADTVWTTICSTTKSSLEEIENELVVESADLLTRQPSLHQINSILLGS